MASRALAHPNITIMWNMAVKEFASVDGESLSHLLLQPVDESGAAPTGAGDGQVELEVDGAFVAIGHIPNTQLFTDVKKNTEGWVYSGSGCGWCRGVGVSGGPRCPNTPQCAKLRS